MHSFVVISITNLLQPLSSTSLSKLLKSHKFFIATSLSISFIYPLNGIPLVVTLTLHITLPIVNSTLVYTSLKELILSLQLLYLFHILLMCSIPHFYYLKTFKHRLIFHPFSIFILSQFYYFTIKSQNNKFSFLITNLHKSNHLIL